MPSQLEEKQSSHAAFWRGEGPSLILTPADQQELYDLTHYRARFGDPQAMWHSEMRRAEPLIDWPTDGIPTVRPNLGVIFVPAMAGLDYQLPGDAMPWPGEPLAHEAIRAVRSVDVTTTETMRLATEFYAIHRESGCQRNRCLSRRHPRCLRHCSPAERRQHLLRTGRSG